MQVNPPLIPLRTKPSKLVGLKDLRRLLGVSQDNVLSVDAIFISIDLEVDGDRLWLHSSAEQPIIRQLGFAKLDTRDICSISPDGNLGDHIIVEAFETKLPPKPKKYSL